MAKDPRQALAELMGLEAPDPEEEIQEARAEEAVLAYTLHPELFSKRTCLNCERVFAVSRMQVAYCGKRCRHEAMRREGLGMAIGLVNGPNGPKDVKWVDRVYFGQEPLIVQPKALTIADEILEQKSTSEDEVVEPIEEIPEPVTPAVTSTSSNSGLDDLFSSFDDFMSS